MSEMWVDPPKQEVPGSFQYGKNDTWKKKNGGAVKKKAKKGEGKVRCTSKIGVGASEMQCTLGNGHDGRHTSKQYKEGWSTLWFWDHGGKGIEKFRYEDQRELEFD